MDASRVGRGSPVRAPVGRGAALLYWPQPDAARRSGGVGERRRGVGVAVEDVLLVRQVHEATVAVASGDRPRPWPRPEADAIVSNDPGAAIAVRIADCVPVLLAEETGRAVAAIHAGWRGIASRAIIAGVSALQATYGVRPERVIAAVGVAVHRPVLLRGAGETPTRRFARPVTIHQCSSAGLSRVLKGSSTSTCGARRAINSKAPA